MGTNKEDELTYGETIKQQFPKMEDIEWVMVETPSFAMSKFIGLNSNCWLDTKIKQLEEYQPEYCAFAKDVHENSKDFKVTWQLKQTDPHAEIKAQHEEALKKYDVVKVFKKDMQNIYPYEDKSLVWDETCSYEIKCYNIDWNKVTRGTEVEVSHDEKIEVPKRLKFLGKTSTMYWCISGIDDDDVVYHKHCRIAKGIAIQDKWLSEVKNES